MSERSILPNHREALGRVLTSDARAAIRGYFLYVMRPTPAEMETGAALISARYREIEHSKDGYTICADLARDVPYATTVMAGLLEADDAAIPERWRSDPNTVRSLLLATAWAEIGLTNAQQAAAAPARGGVLPGLPQRLYELEQLVTALEQ